MAAANKVSISIRLYTPHDVDLICLYRNPEFDFCKAVKAACRAFINQSNERISQPPLNRPRKYFGDLPHITALHLILDKEKDADLVNLLIDTVYAGVRNSFVKNLLRAYMSGFDGSLYFASNYIKHADDANVSLMSEGTVITEINHGSRKKGKQNKKKTFDKKENNANNLKKETKTAIAKKKLNDNFDAKSDSIKLDKADMYQQEPFLKGPVKKHDLPTEKPLNTPEEYEVGIADEPVGETIDDGGAVGSLFANMMNKYQ